MSGVSQRRREAHQASGRGRIWWPYFAGMRLAVNLGYLSVSNVGPSRLLSRCAYLRFDSDVTSQRRLFISVNRQFFSPAFPLCIRLTPYLVILPSRLVQSASLDQLARQVSVRGRGAGAGPQRYR
jgi:hypothetical protein